MSGQIFDIARVRLKALAAMNGRAPQSLDALCQAVGAPDWAVLPALESAQSAGLSEPTADSLWRIPTPQQQAA